MLGLIKVLLVIVVIAWLFVMFVGVIASRDPHKKRRKRQGEYELSEGEKENLRRMDALDRKLRAKRARERRLYGK